MKLLNVPQSVIVGLMGLMLNIFSIISIMETITKVTILGTNNMKPLTACIFSGVFISLGIPMCTMALISWYLQEKK